jgi:hypothetical protein
VEGRIVISFRAVGGPGRGFLERARALDARASAQGAVLVAWDESGVAYAFEHGSHAEAIELLTTPGEDTRPPESAWCIGLAEGDLEPLAANGSRGHLSWGHALAAAALLAREARPGEILCAQSVRALRSGELLGGGTRVATDGVLRVRGVRIDPAVPFRSQAKEALVRMRTAPLVSFEPARAEIVRGQVVVVRADPGAGGTRLLSEIAARARQALVVTPSGSAFEPLGALRRSLARALDRGAPPSMTPLAEPLASLLAGDGVPLDAAAALLAAYLKAPAPGAVPALVVLDDVKRVDPATIDACVRAVRAEDASFALAVHLDATGSLPSPLATLPVCSEREIRPLSASAAEALVGGCLNEAIDASARKRWARLGANVPLGIVEAVSWGIVSGELLFQGERFRSRSVSAGRGKVRGPADWILLRAEEESAPSRLVLGLVALLGGEAEVSRLARVLDAAEAKVSVGAAVEELARGRWLEDTQEGWVSVPSRTHRETLPRLLDDETRRRLHAAAADVIAMEEGAFGRAEAAWHAAQAGDVTRASRILLAAASATADAVLEASTTQLIAFARRADPACEAIALELLAEALSRIRSAFPGPPAPPAAPTSEPADDEGDRPTIMNLAPPEGAEGAEATAGPAPSRRPASAGSMIAVRLVELAKQALLAADVAALQRWVDGLRASGESPIFTERMRAMARIGRGDVGDALRVLRRTRKALGAGDLALRCQTSLALGVALSAAGRPQEALLEGLDALARAREHNDPRGERACLAFLTKVYRSVGRAEEAEALRRQAAT